MTPKGFLSDTKPSRFLCLVLIFCLTYGTIANEVAVSSSLPKTTLQALASLVDGKADNDNVLRDAGGKLGAFAVTNLGPEYTEAVESFRTLAPKCLVSIL
jgi:hypothetical protein